MKSQKVKRILLAVLSVILFAIWWDNLKLFYKNEPTFDVPSEEQFPAPTPKSPREKELAFKTPRVNPFYKSGFEVDKLRTQQKAAVAEVKVEKPSSRHRLLGVLKDKKQPQAVINSTEGSTTVLSLSDSLISWVLIKIDTNLIVFKNEKLLDTLWLETKASLE